MNDVRVLTLKVSICAPVWLLCIYKTSEDEKKDKVLRKKIFFYAVIICPQSSFGDRYGGQSIVGS